MTLFLLLYLEKLPWRVKTQYCQSHSRKTTFYIVNNKSGLQNKPYNDSLRLLRALTLQLHGKGGLVKETSKMLILFLEKIARSDPVCFQGVCLNDIPFFEDLVQLNIFLYDQDFVDKAMLGELSRSSVGNQSNTARLLRCNSRIFNVSKIKALFKTYRSQ